MTLATGATLGGGRIGLPGRGRNASGENRGQLD
jgi:hypothetical protein